MKHAPHSHQHHDLYRNYHDHDSEISGLLGECGSKWRRFDRSPVPSATCPRESVLTIRLRQDFLVVFEGYAGGAEHWPLRQEARKRSLRAEILRTS